MYLSDLGSNPLIIDDGNATKFVDQWRQEGYSFGMTPRDYAAAPFGSANKPARDLSMGETLKRSQFADAIKRADENKTTPDDWRIALAPWIENQQSWGYCHDDATEVLTDRGWRLFAELESSDLLATVNQETQAMEFQAPTARQVFDFNGQMVYSANSRMPFAVTPNHRMYVRKWNQNLRTLNNHYEFVTAENLGWYSGLMSAPSGFNGVDVQRLSIEGDKEYAGDDFVALIALVCSDGFAGNSEKSMNLVSFCCFADRRKQMVSELAARASFNPQPGRDGVWNRWDAGGLATWIRQNCYTGTPGAKTKKVPQFIKELSQRQIEIFLRYFGDQDHARPLTKYYSSSRRMIDDLQELLLRLGKRASINTREPRSSVIKKTGQVVNGGTSYTIHVYQGDGVSIEKKKYIERESYKGPVFCATVPNGTLITRRDDAVLISGNCWGFGTAKAIEICYAMTGYNVPHLNPFPTAYRIKQGRNQGGWAQEYLEGVDKFGIVEHSLWKGNEANMQNWERGEIKANGELHKVTASLELPTNDFAALVTSLTHPKVPRPVTLGLNWWGHLICGVRAVVIEPGKFGIKIVNSWGDSWGEGGCAILTESKATAAEQIRIERAKPRPVAA
jgi:hypothetical protein